MSQSATRTMQIEGRCRQAPRLPRKSKVDVAKCHACRKVPRRPHSPPDPIASPEPAQCHKCRACQAKRRSMSPSATPTMQNEGRCGQVRGDHGVHRTQARHQSQPSAISAAPATQNEGRCRQVPRLPRKMTVDVTKCYACHRRSMSQSATRTMQIEGRCRQAPRLPRKSKVDVAKCHACHAKCRGDHIAHRTQSRHQSQSSAISAAPAAQNEGRCRQVPSLPRK